MQDYAVFDGHCFYMTGQKLDRHNGFKCLTAAASSKGSQAADDQRPAANRQVIRSDRLVDRLGLVGWVIT